MAGAILGVPAELRDALVVRSFTNVALDECLDAEGDDVADEDRFDVDGVAGKTGVT